MDQGEFSRADPGSLAGLMRCGDDREELWGAEELQCDAAAPAGRGYPVRPERV